MKKTIDFEKDGSFPKALRQILGIESTIDEAELVIVDSVKKTLHYLQNTNKKVLQVSYDSNHPMSHLVEDYPTRLRVVIADKVPNLLEAIYKALSELME